MTAEESNKEQFEETIIPWGRLTPNPLTARNDRERYQAVQVILEGIEFTTTITAIRELVNDPKWDDKE